MIRGIRFLRPAIGPLCATLLAACSSSDPVTAANPPTPAPGGPLAPVMRCAPAPGAAVVASADCSTLSAEHRS